MSKKMYIGYAVGLIVAIAVSFFMIDGLSLSGTTLPFLIGLVCGLVFTVVGLYIVLTIFEKKL